MSDFMLKENREHRSQGLMGKIELNVPDKTFNILDVREVIELSLNQEHNVSEFFKSPIVGDLSNYKNKVNITRDFLQEVCKFNIEMIISGTHILLTEKCDGIFVWKNFSLYLYAVNTNIINICQNYYNKTLLNVVWKQFIKLDNILELVNHNKYDT